MLRTLALIATQVFIMPFFAIAAMGSSLVSPGGPRALRIIGAWGRLSLAVSGVEVRVHGREEAEAAGPAVIVANHTSAQDIYLALGYVPIPYRMVAKESLFRIPFLGLGMRATGMVPLERSGTRRDVRRLAELDLRDPAAQRLFAFPEGTRSPDGRLQRFKRGAFATAVAQGVPVIPLAIVGACRVQPPHSWGVRGGRVELRFLAPVFPAGPAHEDRDALMDEVWRRMTEALPAEQRPGATD